MYALLVDPMLGSEVLPQEELDSQDLIQKKWDSLVEQADVVRDSMHGKRAEFKARLQSNTEQLVLDVDEFRDQFEKNGPQEPGL